MSDAGSAAAVANLSKRFGALQAVQDLSFTIGRGEIFGLVGPDGAGKTTTLRILAGVMAADAGSVVVDGVDVLADPDGVRSHISYMPQRFALYEDLTVEENIRFFAEIFEVPRAQRIQRAARLLAASGMEPFRKRLAGQLSGGMKQKLGLTCSLVHAPRVVLLDEPTTGVDPVSRREFWHILYDLRAEGVSIVISTAYLDEAERCDRLALLHRGRVAYCESPLQLRARMPGVLLEVATNTPRELRACIGALPGVLGTLIVGDGVHVHLDSEDRLAALVQSLTAAGIAFEPPQRIAPSVEDLFVALLGQEGT